jgi:hypothetical protein
MFIEANPQYKSVHLYDGQMKRVQKENIEQYVAEKKSNGKQVKQVQKEGLKTGNDNKEGQKAGEKKSGWVKQKIG